MVKEEIKINYNRKKGRTAKTAAADTPKDSLEKEKKQLELTIAMLNNRLTEVNSELAEKHQ